MEGALQTRKWTGNDGVEKYTTEVILQGFNSTLTMLDGRGEGGANFTSDTSSYGDENSTSVNSSGNESSEKVTSGDLDDEIPF